MPVKQLEDWKIILFGKEDLKMLEARKRTALDGKVWWCVFDTDTWKWSTIVLFGRYKTKRDCQIAIDGYKRLSIKM